LPRNVERQQRPDRRDQQIRRPEREQHPERAAEQCEDEAFRQELANDARAARTDREPDCDLLPTRGATRQEHRREVQARDNEHDTRHRDDQAAERCERGVILRWCRTCIEPRQRAGDERLVFLLDGNCLLKFAASCVRAPCSAAAAVSPVQPTDRRSGCLPGSGA
jgi:hypothetical protein